MDITHVFRGEEHLSNTPKQLQLYDYFGWNPPLFGHMTLIINEQGKKLSKRDLSIVQFMSQYRSLGYLPEAIFNFILLLGWAPEGTQEMFTKEEAIGAFDPARLSSSPSFFDVQKLNWINAQYIKHLSIDAYRPLVQPFILRLDNPSKLDEELIFNLSSLFKEQILFGKQLISLLQPLLTPNRTCDDEASTLLAMPESRIALKTIAEKIKTTDTLTPESVKALMKDVQLETGIKGKPLFMPIRLALTGQLHGVEMAQLIPVLGKTIVLERLASL